jgi:hypothetical protein
MFTICLTNCSRSAQPFHPKTSPIHAFGQHHHPPTTANCSHPGPLPEAKRPGFWTTSTASKTALNSGVSRASVIEILSANGFEITLNSFASALRRVRQRRARKGLGVSPRSIQPSPKALAFPSGEPAGPGEADLDSSASPVLIGSHNPSDLNKIFSQKPDLGALAKLAKTKHT